jgi:hypothetical protein
MELFEEILMAGGHSNSLGRASEVLDAVRSDRSRLDELFDCIFADDAWVRMRAIDSFEKIIKDNPEWIGPYLNRILGELTLSSQPSIQWHLAQIFAEVSLTDKQRLEVVAWLRHMIATTDVDWIVSVNVMKALLYFYRNKFVVASDIKRLFKAQEGHASKSVRKKAAEFLLTLG